jgi:hypothetical protein
MDENIIVLLYFSYHNQCLVSYKSQRSGYYISKHKSWPNQSRLQYILRRHPASIFSQLVTGFFDVVGITHPTCEPKDLITFFPLINIRPDFYDNPRELDTEYSRDTRWEGIPALALQDIHSIQPKRLNLINAKTLKLGGQAKLHLTLTSISPDSGFGVWTSPM